MFTLSVIQMEVEIPLADLVPREEPLPEPRQISVLEQMKVRFGIEYKLRIRDYGFFINFVLAVMLVWSYTSVNDTDLSPLPDLPDPPPGPVHSFGDDFSTFAHSVLRVRAFPFAEWSDRVLSTLVSDFTWFDSPQSLFVSFANSSKPEVAFLFGGTPFETNLSITKATNMDFLLGPFGGTLAIVESLLRERHIVAALRSCEIARPEQSRFSPSLVFITLNFPYAMLLPMAKHTQYNERQREDRVHFLLHIFGIGEIAYWLSSVVIHLVEQVLITLLSTLAFYDTVQWSKGTALNLFFVSLLMNVLGLILLHEFFFAWLKGKNSLWLYFSVQIAVSSLILTVESLIPAAVVGLFCLIMSQFSFLNVMIDRKVRGNPMTWKRVDGPLFAWQVLSLLFWGVWNVICTLCGTQLHGRPPLGWKSLFPPSKWKKLVVNGKIIVNPVTALEVETVRKEFGETVAIDDLYHWRSGRER
jgi:hypothetical protein